MLVIGQALINWVMQTCGAVHHACFMAECQKIYMLQNQIPDGVMSRQKKADVACMFRFIILYFA